jgi:hypothetical protein
VVIKIFKARLLATTYANDKALVTTGLTQYTEKAKQKHCQHNIVAVPYLFYQPASLLWFINSETTKQEVSTTPIEILFVDSHTDFKPESVEKIRTFPRKASDFR